eukprot:jgi/Psemu1/52434/gm1.52434_g
MATSRSNGHNSANQQQLLLQFLATGLDPETFRGRQGSGCSCAADDWDVGERRYEIVKEAPNAFARLVAPNGFKEKHLLWALHFLKQYPNTTVMASTVKPFEQMKTTYDKTLQKWRNIVLPALNALHPHVIKWSNRFTNDCGNDVLAGVDTMDCPFQQILVPHRTKPGKFTRNKVLYSKNLNGPSLHYKYFKHVDFYTEFLILFPSFFPFVNIDPRPHTYHLFYVAANKLLPIRNQSTPTAAASSLVAIASIPSTPAPPIVPSSQYVLEPPSSIAPSPTRLIATGIPPILPLPYLPPLHQSHSRSIARPPLLRSFHNIRLTPFVVATGTPIHLQLHCINRLLSQPLHRSDCHSIDRSRAHPLFLTRIDATASIAFLLLRFPTTRSAALFVATASSPPAAQHVPRSLFRFYFDAPDWRSASVESLVSLASACFQGSADWTKSPPGQVLRKCLIGLAKMSPECFDDLYGEGNLMPSTEGKVWLAANWVLGSHWFFKTKPPAPAPAPTAASESSTQASGSRSVSFLPSVGAASVISSSDGHFLQQRGVCSSDSRAPVDVTEGTKRSYSSYFTLSLPRLMSPCPSDLYDEMLESLTDALSLLWSAKPIPKLWSTLPDWRTLELYVAVLWLWARAAPHLRFYMAPSGP